MPGDSCKDGAKWATTAGVILIVSGLMGFVATVSTAEDDDAKPKPVEIKDVTEAQAGDGERRKRKEIRHGPRPNAAERGPAQPPAKSEASAGEPMAGSAAQAP